MTQEELVLNLIRGQIAGLPDEERRKVDDAAAEMRELVLRTEGAGHCALALVGAELATDIDIKELIAKSRKDRQRAVADAAFGETTPAT